MTLGMECWDEEGNALKGTIGGGAMRDSPDRRRLLAQITERVERICGKSAHGFGGVQSDGITKSEAGPASRSKTRCAASIA